MLFTHAHKPHKRWRRKIRKDAFEPLNQSTIVFMFTHVHRPDKREKDEKAKKTCISTPQAFNNYVLSSHMNIDHTREGGRRRLRKHAYQHHGDKKLCLLFTHTHYTTQEREEGGRMNKKAYRPLKVVRSNFSSNRTRVV
jgi:hypothetical protein